MSNGVSGGIEKSWSVGIMGVVWGGETKEEGEDEGKTCEWGEGRKGGELHVEGMLLPSPWEEIVHEQGTQPHQRSHLWKYTHVGKKDHNNETPSD